MNRQKKTCKKIQMEGFRVLITKIINKKRGLGAIPVNAQSQAFPAFSNLQLWDFPVLQPSLWCSTYLLTGRFYFSTSFTLILTQKDNYLNSKDPLIFDILIEQSKSAAFIMQTSILLEMVWDQKVTGEWGASNDLWSYFCRWDLFTRGRSLVKHIWSFICVGVFFSVFITAYLRYKSKPALEVQMILHLEFVLIQVTKHCMYKGIFPCLVAQLC